MSNIKKPKSIFILILSLALILSIALGITLAVAFKELEKRANNFTFGDLTIELVEDKWEDVTDKITYPGRSFVKDPVVKNTGRTDAYMYVEVRVPREEIQTVVDENVTALAETDLFTYNINSGWTQIGGGTVSDDGKYTIYVYAYTDKAVSGGEQTPTLFDSVVFVNALEGQPEMGETFDILISATGIQAGYLNETGDTTAEKIINAYTLSQSQGQ